MTLVPNYMPTVFSNFNVGNQLIFNRYFYFGCSWVYVSVWKEKQVSQHACNN